MFYAVLQAAAGGPCCYTICPLILTDWMPSTPIHSPLVYNYRAASLSGQRRKLLAPLLIRYKSNNRVASLVGARLLRKALGRSTLRLQYPDRSTQKTAHCKELQMLLARH